MADSQRAHAMCLLLFLQVSLASIAPAVAFTVPIPSMQTMKVSSAATTATMHIRRHIRVDLPVIDSQSLTLSATKRGMGEETEVQPKKKRTGSKSQKGTSKRGDTNIPVDAQPLYWREDGDDFFMIDESSDNKLKKVLKFTVRGKPVPLKRHRTSRGFMYNPSSQSQIAFREVVSELICSSEDGDEGLRYYDGADVEPIFQEDEFLSVTILFRMRRPKSHFVGGKSGPGRLRPTSPGRLHPTRTDVDNLAKFVLDSLNELVYADDRQVISLHAAKVMDSEGHCEGATEVTICRLQEDEMESFVSNMANP